MAVKQMKNGFWLGIILGLLLTQSLPAVEVQGLYETEVVARSQSPEDRELALQNALKQVLARVLAARNIEQDATAQRALASAYTYVREYQYSMTEVSNNNPHARIMRVLFDEQKLDALLKSSQLGLWNEIRPETLLWLVVEEQGKRQFFNADKMALLNGVFKDASKLQGVPLLFPLMDVQEQSLLSVAEVLSPYPHPLLDVSGRYEVVSILVGLLVHKNNCWYSEWAHYFNQAIQQWQGECGSLQQAALSGMQGTYEQLAEYYAVKPDLLALNSFVIKVAGVKGVQQAAEITRYLRSLAKVANVNWMSIEGEYNLFQVQVKGERQAFVQVLVADKILQAIGANGLGDLSFQWAVKSK